MKKILTLCLLMADHAANAQYVGVISPAYLYNPTTRDLKDGESTDRGNLAGWTASRVQQVIGAADFIKVAPQGGWIETVELIADPAYNVVIGREVKGVSISLGTTRSGPDSLSPIFADNLVFDLQQGRRAEDGFFVNIIQAKGGKSGSSYRLALTKPYFYDPNKGNLFVDLQQERADLGVVFDFERSKDSGVGSVFGYGDTLPKEGEVISGGFVMAFLMTPVPEPSTVGLAALGGAVLLAAAGARKDDQN